MRLTMIWLTVLAAGCTKPGDFCEVWTGEKVFDPETARVMVQTDRPDVEGIAVENEYGRRHCRWKASL